MTIFHDKALRDMFPEGGRRAALPNLGLCRCEHEPETKYGFGAVSPMGTIVFSSEILSPRAQEQLRQMPSKVKGTDNAGKAGEPSG